MFDYVTTSEESISPLYVTSPYLPPPEEYIEKLKGIWESRVLTNRGRLALELQRELEQSWGVEHVLCVANGTIALQLALATADIHDGEVITTPFSYVATISSILWERCTPVFVDIEPEHYTIDAAKIEEAITPRTRAIMGVHVFGYACAVEVIEEIAARHGLPVIYDGAHAYAARYKGKSLMSYGDFSTCSFHATKLFHTAEGGAVVVKDAAAAARLDLLHRFGHNGDEHLMLGINAKLSELHAAMGLSILPHVDEVITRRCHLCEQYDTLLGDAVERPAPQAGLEPNYAYYPVLFRDEVQLTEALRALAQQGIYARRYFYPSLNRLPYLPSADECPVAEGVSGRIACLPLCAGMSDADVRRVSSAILAVPGMRK